MASLAARMARLQKRVMGIRRRLLSLAPGVAVAWAGFWGLVTWNVVVNNSGPGAVIGGLISAVAALLPATMLLMRRKPAREQTPPPKLPTAVRPSYRRLIAAYDQVRGLVDEGVIDASVLEGVEDRIEVLIRLLAADVTNQKLGGQPSRRLREQVDQLTGLLVGVVDAALDRRTAALASDDQAASSLREALVRLRAEEQGYRELDQLGEEH